MDIESIRLFTEVVARGGISEAARRNNLSQQTLSRRIIVLENEVGARLFERGQRVEPTAAGKAFLDYAYEVMALTSKMRDAVRRANHCRTGRLRLKRYATDSFFLIISRAMEELSATRPEVRVEVVDKNEDDVLLVLDGLIDLGFERVIVREGEGMPTALDGLVRVPLQSNVFPLTLGVVEGHPLLANPFPTLADVAAFRVATPSFASNGAIPCAMRDLFSREGLGLRIDMVLCQSLREYYSHADADSVVVFNESFQPETASTKLRRYVALTLADGPFLVGARALYSPVNGNPALPAAIDAILVADRELKP